MLSRCYGVTLQAFMAAPSIKAHELLPHSGKPRLPCALYHEAAYDVMRDHSFYSTAAHHPHERLIVHVAHLNHNVALQSATKGNHGPTQSALAFKSTFYVYIPGSKLMYSDSLLDPACPFTIPGVGQIIGAHIDSNQVVDSRWFSSFSIYASLAHYL